MKYEAVTWFSNILNREMHAGIYGHAGKIFVAFAPQNGTCNDYADFGMVEEVSAWIDQGRLMVVTVDSIDQESWSDEQGNPSLRAFMQEQWFKCITDEFYPMIQEKTGNYDKMMTTGCSMGGTHAGNAMLRRPDLFDGTIALSGAYNADFFFHGYMDGMLYQNSPVHYMRNLPLDHPYIEMFNQCPMYFCIGQGAWEHDLLPSNRDLAEIFAQKGMNAVVDFWGYDVYHDWPWWKIQIKYFMEKILGPA